MLFVKFEDLCMYPDTEMMRIYNYLEIPYYKHDFDNVEQVTKEDDAVYGIYGDHKLRKEFKRQPNDYNEILGFENCERIKRHYQWFYDYFGYV